MKKLWWLLLAAAGALAAAPVGGTSCESLSKLAVSNTAITSAQVVPAGEFTAPAGRGPAPSFNDLPAFCRVQATLTPSADSDIKIEVWLPASRWNGKFQAVGNGGWAGIISYGPLGAALRRGYAAASTDTGHVGGSARFALGHPEKLTDFAYRAVHETTVAAKAIIANFYGSGPRYSYWNGCSTGGRQGLKEAQRFPTDFDGIIAGAPANYQMHLHVWSVAVAQAMHKEPGSYIPPEKYPAIHKAALEACDSLDGLKDGLIQDPTRCHFDPKVLECKDADSPACLTAPQVEAARKLYAPVKNSRTGGEIFPGMEPGSELGWAGLAGPNAAAVATDTFTYLVYKDPGWDWHTLNADTDTARADKNDKGLIDAIDPNLKPFFSHKGKLIMYHGWSDQLIAPGNSVNYFGSVAKKMGSKSAEEIRLFMVPGMAHCAGGEGPNTFDMVSALEQWVEQDHAPEQIIASHSQNGTVDRTRPLCPYPQVARYKGSGSIDEAANFTCATPTAP
jgi:tannase/feruloyl esterase